MKQWFVLLFLLTSVCAQADEESRIVVRDAEVQLRYDEVRAALATMPDTMRRAAASDSGDLLEVLNTLIVTRRMAATLDEANPQSDAFWQLQLRIANLKQRFVVEQFRQNLDYPDFSALARERYQADRDRYALVPEHRKVSHILLFCPPGCDREPLRPKAAMILQQLQDGAEFEAMVDEYSEDQASKARQGMFDRWFKLGDPEVEPHFTGAAFELAEIGELSPVVDTPFGLHIIRLEGIRAAYHREYAEVSEQILAELRNEYRALAEKEFMAQFHLSPEVELDTRALDQLLLPYRDE